MKILVFQSSPNLHGSTALMVESFASGARAAGHSVEILCVSRLDIRPCTGCVHCGYEGPCVQKDDMTKVVREKILSADMLVFATPLYYYGMSAQLKTLVDRFCSMNASITSKRMKSALLTVAWNSDDWTFEALVAHYRTLVRYLDFEDMGMILGYGCGSTGMTKRSGYLEKAKALGSSLS